MLFEIKQKLCNDVIERNLVQHSYQSLQLSSFIIFINALILSYGQYGLISNDIIYTWFISITVITFIRLGFSYLYFKAPDRFDTNTWKSIFYGGVISSGLLWGSTSIYLYPQEDIAHQTFLIIIIAGMSAGAITTLSSVKHATTIFLTLTLIPLIYTISLENNEIHNMMLVLITLFFLVLVISSEKYHKSVYKTLITDMELKKSQEDLYLSKEKFKNILKEAPIGIFLYNEHFQITEINDSILNSMGLDRINFENFNLMSVENEYIKKAIIDVFQDKRGHFEGEYHHINGTPLYVDMKTTPIYDKNHIIGGMAIVNDYTEKMKFIQKIEYQAYNDTLTGIPNRNKIMEFVKKELEHYKRTLRIFGVMFIDLDNFKIINDTFGHNVGDKVLKETVKRLKNLLRIGDIVGRFGSDEFIIIISDIDKDNKKSTKKLEVVAEKIHSSLSESFIINGHTIRITTSIGVVLVNNLESKSEEIINNSNNSMLKAKKEGKNITYFYQQELGEWLKKRLNVEKYLRKAIDNKEFEMYYQPVIDLEKNKIIGAEALIRWISPELGFVPPDKFIEISEDNGMIFEIGDFVIENVCYQMSKWVNNEYYSDIEKISLNVSPKQFMQNDFIKNLIMVVEKYDIPPSKLIIELTESALLSNMEETGRKIQELLDYGIKTSIDDFGTGYSSLYHIKSLPFSILKIDRSFVQDINDTEDAKLIKSILDISNNFNMKVVAEGIETVEQKNFLSNLNCEYGQGYLFGKPIPTKDFERLLKEYNANN